jgi:parallel beta-helix repeat protein
MLAVRRQRISAPTWSRGARPRSRGARFAQLTPAACVVAGFMVGCAAVVASASMAWAWSGAARPAVSRTVLVTSLGDFGTGTLRWAIGQADSSAPGSTTAIDFSVTGIISVASALPAISADVSIDGQSAPGYRPGGPPLVAVNFGGRPGLRFAPGSRGSQLLGIAADDAGGNAVTLDAGFITLNADYIGLDLLGAAAGNQGDGIYASARSGGDRIGLNPAGDPGVVGNVISGNSGNGIVLAGSSGDTVAANRIGTSPDGLSAVGNGGDGILITARADGNEIGGTKFTDPLTGQANNPTGTKGTVPPVFVVPPLGNLISGNSRDGVTISAGSRGNVLNGNFIGTAASGNAPLGNGGNGVWIDGASRNSLVGCKFVNNPFVYYNVLSGNRRNGLRITNSGHVTVQGNFFGIGANNTALVGNRLDGILVDGTSANTQVGGVIPLGNVSAGNGANGIAVTGRVHGFVTFNTFGGLLAFKGAAPNRNDGLLVTSTGGDNLARTNVFSGNARNGIELAGNASGVTIDPDIAGLSTNGMSALPNGGDGLLITGTAHSNTVGGSRRSVIPQDTFAGNRGYGVVITGRAHGNRVFGSYIGTQLLGLRRMPNGKGGVLVGGNAHGNVVGGGRTLPSNIISGNTGNGVTLGRRTTRNFVIRNYIGLDRIGRRLPNTGRPVADYGRRNTVRANRTRPARWRR